MPHQKIYLPEPQYATKEVAEAAGLWRPRGLMVQWRPFDEITETPGAVGIATGVFHETDEDKQRVERGETTIEDMFMEWFDRYQLNRIVSTLRRARNAAYGADE